VAGKSTLNRLELGADEPTAYYEASNHQIVPGEGGSSAAPADATVAPPKEVERKQRDCRLVSRMESMRPWGAASERSRWTAVAFGRFGYSATWKNTVLPLPTVIVPPPRSASRPIPSSTG